MEFSDDEVVVDGVLVLQLTGDVDLSSSARLRRRLESALADHDRLVVDLTAVTFFDSSGLKVLDDVQTTAHRADTALTLVCPPGRVLLVFELTGLRDRFDIHETLDSAVSSRTSDG